MNPDVVAWLNRSGLLLDFLAFWFAAPEILGEKRLSALEHRAEEGMIVLGARVLPVLLRWLAGAAAFALLGYWFVNRLIIGGRYHILDYIGLVAAASLSVSFLAAATRRKETEAVDVALLVMACAATTAFLVFVLYRALIWGDRWWVKTALLGVPACVFTGWLAYRQPTQVYWWPLGAALAAEAIWILGWWTSPVVTVLFATIPFLAIQDKVLPPLLRVLAEDGQVRRRSLALGAVLFVSGFLLQFAGTF